MKKIILILVLSIFVHIETKAQNYLLADVGYKAVFPGNINYLNKVTTATTIYSLSDSTPITKDYAYYMLKSKNQRTAGLVFLGSGIVLSGIGVLVIGRSSFDESRSNYGLLIMGLGAISGIISIPLMISGHTNRIKAKLMISNQKTGFGVPPNVSKDITGITLALPIGK